MRKKGEWVGGINGNRKKRASSSLFEELFMSLDRIPAGGAAE